MLANELFNKQLLEQGYALIDQFLAQEISDNLYLEAQQLYQQEAFHQGQIGNKEQQAATKIRRDKIYWLEEDNPQIGIQQYLQTMQQLQQHLNQSFYLGLKSFEAHFALYEKGDFYSKHIDQFKGSTARQISTVYYLNAQWLEKDGGILQLYDVQDALLAQIAPVANRLVCFASDLPHEVLVSHQARYSIAGWFKNIRA